MLQRSTNSVIFAFVLDVGVTLVAVALSFGLRANLPFGRPLLSEWDWNVLYWLAGLLYPLVFFVFALYDSEHIFRATEEYQSLFAACLLGGLALAGLVYFSNRDISRLSLVYFFALQFALLASWRSLFHWVDQMRRSNGKDERRVLLVGAEEPARYVVEQLCKPTWADVRLVGYLTDGGPISFASGTLTCLGNLSEVEPVIEEYRISDVLLTLPAESYAKIQQLVAELVDKPCNVWIVPDYFSLLRYGSSVYDLGGLPLISIKLPALSGHRRLIKRGFDLLFGGLLLLAFLPIMGIIALAIRMTSSGPAIFKQQRVGENGSVFWMYKFRSMVADADQRFDEVLHRDERGNQIFKSADDHRVTRLGHFLRRTSLDELPQLFNAMKGEMSLVGPRPELPRVVEEYHPWQHKRFAFPPGITGWWQVSGRSDKPMQLHTEDDLYYVQNYSLWLDVKILTKTFWVVLRGIGAY